ncbi:MAG: hypothetical protein AAF492_25115, partial [Verrucomicrobiota bacterium]
PPRLPIASTATGDWLTHEEATSPDYWTRHLRRTVQFSPAMKTLAAKPLSLGLEVGPRRTLCTLGAQCVEDFQTIPSLSDNAEDDAEWKALLDAAGQLWTLGVDIDWHRFHAGESRQRLSLPTYPFEGDTYWVNPSTSSGTLHQIVEKQQSLMRRQQALLGNP